KEVQKGGHIMSIARGYKEKSRKAQPLLTSDRAINDHDPLVDNARTIVCRSCGMPSKKPFLKGENGLLEWVLSLKRKSKLIKILDGPWEMKAQEQQKKGMVGTPRSRAGARRPLWVGALVGMVCLSILGAYIYSPTFLKVKVCPAFCGGGPVPLLRPPPPPPPPTIMSDREMAARIVAQDILKMPLNLTKMRKIAFMFLTPGPLPFDMLWEEFFKVRLCLCSLCPLCYCWFL
ncbi:hypothetical protein KI387_023260, partial [Taxus chinensis]